MLHYKEEFAAVLTAVNVYITKVDASLVGFASYVRSETLSKRGFSRAHLARYDYSLSHPLRKFQQKIEELHQQTVFFFPVRQTAWNVVYVEFCLVFEHTLMPRHGILNLKPNYFSRAVLFFSLPSNHSF
jgi:hypothetical protein